MDVQIEQREVWVREEPGGIQVVCARIDEVEHCGDGGGKVGAEAETVNFAVLIGGVSSCPGQ